MDQDIPKFANQFFSTRWSMVLLAGQTVSPESAAALHSGENVLAVHVHHEDFEPHYADVGMVDVQWPDSEKTTP